MTWKKIDVICVIALALVAAGGAQAGPINLVTNGDFESTPGATGSFFLGDGSGSLTGWFLGSPKGISNEILFAPGTADTTGATRSDGVKFGLWGPNNGVANGLPATSPSGGNFVALDGDTSANVSLNQTITGLTAGSQYQVSFEWAASQYWFINDPPNFTGATGDSFQVSLGSQTFTTPEVNIASQGFSGWMTESFTFTANSSSEVLSFLAVGSPNGLPPVALLDGVSLESAATATPEPASLSLLLIGMLSFGAVGLRRRAKRAAV